MDARASFGGQRQMELYLRGVGCALPVASRRLQLAARRAMAPEIRDFVEGGAGAEETLRANRAALADWRIVPRMLRGAAERQLGVRLFDRPLAAPIVLAPVGAQRLLHADAEAASTRAAAALGLPFVLSTVSSLALEAVAEAAPAAERWFQLYWGKDRGIVSSMIARAERAGYSVLMLTLDSPMLGWRPRDLGRGYMPFLHGEGLGNFYSDPAFCGQLGQAPAADPQAAVALWGRVFSNPGLTWEDLRWLRGQTRLPMVVKGILHPGDARLALEAGVDGIVVSNHGGRQVDGAVGALAALPGVVEAVAGRVPVLFDSGIRGGADVFKALSLGARAVLIGRWYLWGLALAGEAGVSEAMRNLIGELDLTLALSGYRTPGELTPEALARDRAR